VCPIGSRAKRCDGGQDRAAPGASSLSMSHGFEGRIFKGGKTTRSKAALQDVLNFCFSDQLALAGGGMISTIGGTGVEGVSAGLRLCQSVAC
jgi:hypothetical protein